MEVFKQRVLRFWRVLDILKDGGMNQALAKKWYLPDPAFDASIASEFGPMIEELSTSASSLKQLQDDPDGKLASIVLFDQLPRNAFRGSGRAFQFDSIALKTAKELVSDGSYASFHPAARIFIYMPFEHSEDLSDQEKSVSLFEELLDVTDASSEWYPMLQSALDYARRHLAIVSRFGRFPHRNKLLGRSSTPEEAQYLANGGETFGVKAEKE